MAYKEYKKFAETTAREAGIFIKSRLGRIRQISYKGRMNLVTDVDTACDRLIVGRINAKFPSHAVISEETGATGPRDAQYKWIIDPLDGTTNYAHGFLFFCVSIALLKDGEAIVAAVYDPCRDELFSAASGSGAFLNNKKIAVSGINRLKRSLLATGFPYKFGMEMKRNIDNFSRFMMKVQAVRRAGSAALDLCYVACGRFDGFWELDLHPWDTAAAALIVEEAGGRVTTFSGKLFNPYKKEIIASNGKIHKEMLGVIR